MSDFRHACRALWGARRYSSAVIATLTSGLTLARWHLRPAARRALGSVALGLAAGMLASTAAARVIKADLYRVSPFDPAVWTLGALSVIRVYPRRSATSPRSA
jgi:hypothetical protein